MESLREYLFSTGAINGTEEDIAEAKALYRKRYQKQYQKEYFQNRSRRILWFSKDEFVKLQEYAVQHQASISVTPTFLKQCISSTVTREYILADQEQLFRLERGLRAWGNNLNQIARIVNSTKQCSDRNILSVIEIVNSLETLVSQTLRNPTPLLEQIDISLNKSPEFRDEMQNILNQHNSHIHDN